MATIHNHFPVIISYFGPRAVIAIAAMRAYYGPYPQPGWFVEDLNEQAEDDGE